MKITVQQLRRIIKEEVSKVMNEANDPILVSMDEYGKIEVGPKGNMKVYRGPQEFSSRLTPGSVLSWEEATSEDYDEEPSDLGYRKRSGGRWNW